MKRSSNTERRWGIGAAIGLAGSLLLGVALGAASPASAASSVGSTVPGSSIAGTGLVHQASSPRIPFAVGSRVSCNWQGRGRMYSGTIARRYRDGRIRVHYDDGDRETTSARRCRLLTASIGGGGYGGFQVGSRVRCNWQERGRMYSGTVVRKFGPTTIRVHYDDGDRETTSTWLCRRM